MPLNFITIGQIGLLLSALLGIVLFILGNNKRRIYRKLTTYGIRTEGTVVELVKSRTGRSVNMLPKISYKTVNDQQIIKEYSIGENPSPYHVGDSVSLYYDVDDNDVFILDDKLAKRVGPFFICVGILLVVISLIIYFV